MRYTLALILLLIYSSLVGQYRFEHLSVNDGLSQNSVNDIYQDSEGFIWFATQDGLDRFDGYEFESYNKDTNPSVAAGFLWSIVEDQHGNIWTASPAGANRLDWKNGKSTRFFITKQELFEGASNQVSTLHLLSEKMIISFDVGQHYLIDPQMYQDSSEVYLDKEHLFTPDENQAFDLGIYGVHTFEDQTFFLSEEHLHASEAIPLPGDVKTSIFKSSMHTSANGFYFGTLSGLFFFDISSKSIEKVACISDPVNDLLWRPSEEVFWVGTDRGVVIFDPTNQKCLDRIVAGEEDDDLTNSWISSLHETRDGLIWLGTANGGINIYDPAKDRFKFLTDKNGLDDHPVWSISKNDSYLYIGMDNGLYVCDLDGSLEDNHFAQNAVRKITKVRHPYLDGKRITTIDEVEKGKLLIGTYLGEIVIYYPANQKFELVPLPKNSRHTHIVSAIKQIREDIWVPTQNGLFKFKKNLGSFEYLDYYQDSVNFPTNYYLTALVDKDETLWLGTNLGFQTISSGGENEFHLYDSSEPDSLSPAFNFITGFFEDKYDRIWMSTFGGGVSCYEPKKGTFFHIKKSDGLTSNICASIEGNDSLVFVSTNDGLSKIDIRTLGVESYSTEDGLLSDEFAIASSSSSGEMFLFGTVNGLVLFSPKDLARGENINQPTISSLEINYEPRSIGSMVDNRLDLSPSDKIFSLQFSNMSFRKRNEVLYQYKLTGFNEDWVTARANERRATYSLPPGEYNFQLRSVIDGKTGPTSNLSVIVHPAFYQTWWFYSLIALASTILVAALSRYYSNQQLKERLRKLELQQKIQSERERISRDLHDNVGSQITYIATSINNLSGGKNTEELKELGEFTRDTMRQLRETIWVINNDEVSIDELRNKVLEYASEILKPHPEIVHEVSFPKSEMMINPERAINIFRLIQEALNNAVKHASPTKIKIKLQLSEFSKLTITDDGLGFDGEDKMGHFGLINMRKRAQELGAKLDLKTAPGKGTSIELSNFKIGQMT